MPLFVENLNYFKDKPNKKIDVIFIKWVLADIYIRLNKEDVALNYINNELKTLPVTNPYYPYYIMYKGICLNLKNDFNQRGSRYKSSQILYYSATGIIIILGCIIYSIFFDSNVVFLIPIIIAFIIFLLLENKFLKNLS